MVGIIGVDKPQAFTSFDVVAKLRGIIGVKRIGHGGTLDPMATGVLPIFVGRATKALDVMPIQDKSYTAGFKLGIATDTQDITGKVLEEIPATFTKEQIETILKTFTGEITQLPPMYSAVSVGGVRLYDLARQGKEVDRPTRQITIHEISLLSFDETEQEGTLHIACSKGTYVRTIIHDMGHQLGSCGTMTTLRRTATLGYTIDQCFTLEELQALKDKGELATVILPVETAFSTYPKINLTSEQGKMFGNGVRLDTNRIDNVVYDSMMTVYQDDIFLGLATATQEDAELKMEKLFYLGK